MSTRSLFLFGICRSFGKIALQLPLPLFGSEMTPSAPEWHSSLTVDGMPDRESSTAGSSKPVKPPSCGSSRKIALGFGRCSDLYRFARFAVMTPPKEKPK